MSHMLTAAAAVTTLSDAPSEPFAAGIILFALMAVAFSLEGKLRKSQKVDDVIRVFLAVSFAGLASLVPQVRGMGRNGYDGLRDVFVRAGMPEQWAAGSASFLGVVIGAVAIFVFYKLQGKGGTSSALGYLILILGTYSIFTTQVGREFVNWIVTGLGVYVWNFLVEMFS